MSRGEARLASVYLPWSTSSVAALVLSTSSRVTMSTVRVTDGTEIAGLVFGTGIVVGVAVIIVTAGFVVSRSVSVRRTGSLALGSAVNGRDVAANVVTLRLVVSFGISVSSPASSVLGGDDTDRDVAANVELNNSVDESV